MRHSKILFTAVAAFAAGAGPGASAWAGVQVGSSGKTYASDAVQCTANQAGALQATVEAGLLDPKRGTRALVLLNGGQLAELAYANPVTPVLLVEGGNTVVVALSRKTADSYAFTVNAGQCSTAGNWPSADGTLEYAGSGKSYATVTPGCALNARTGLTQPYVHLFDNGGFLLDVSVDGVPLTQLSALKTHTPVFLGAGWNVISAANAGLSTDYFVRHGGTGQCVLAQ